jgi:hypothetical protein
MNYRQVKRWLKRYCRAHHIEIRRGFSVRTNTWGKPARRMCEDVQAREGLPITGQPDARTVLAIMPFRLKLVRIARAELGTRETPAGSNWGDRVRQYLAAAGITFPTAWCMAFVIFVMKKAGWKGSWPERRAWVPDFDAWATAKGYERRKLSARRGYVVTFNWDSDPASEHVGFIIRNLGPLKQVLCLEGNATSPEIPGGGVVTKWRYWSNVNHTYKLPDYL